MPNSPFELKPHEDVLEIVRESIIPNLFRLSVYIIWVLVPFFFLFPLFRQGMVGIVIFFLLALSGVFMLTRRLKRWSGTMLVLTDKRIVDIDQRGFFDRTVTETPYSQIDEASYRVKGVCATLFRFGSVRLEVKGSAADIQFERIFHPARIHDLINDLRQESREKPV